MTHFRLPSLKSLMVKGDREMKVLSSQAVTLRVSFWFMICRAEGKLDKGMWRTRLTTACPHHQIVSHTGQPDAMVEMGLGLLNLEKVQIENLLLSIYPNRYQSVMC